VAVAEATGSVWKKRDDKKAELARELFEKKLLSKDLHDEMLRLNTLRKDVSYGEEGFELRDEDLEDPVSELESMLDEIESIIAKLEEEAEG
jgi:hypothetical protein